MYNIVNQLGVESIYSFVKPGSKHIQPLTEELDIGVYCQAKVQLQSLHAVSVWTLADNKIERGYFMYRK